MSTAYIVVSISATALFKNDLLCLWGGQLYWKGGHVHPSPSGISAYVERPTRAAVLEIL